MVIGEQAGYTASEFGIGHLGQVLELVGCVEAKQIPMFGISN